MKLIYNLVNSRWKLPLIVMCTVFNLTFLVYFARPASNIEVQEESPRESLKKPYAENEWSFTNTNRTPRKYKHKLIVKAPVTFVRHLPSKVNSSRFSHSKQKLDFRNSTTTSEKDSVHVNETMVQSPKSTKVKFWSENGVELDETEILQLKNLKDGSSHPKKADLNFNVLINPKEMCQRDIYLLIVVCSAVQRVEYRAVIRETWGSVIRRKHLGVRVVFILGNPDAGHAHFQSAIQAESDKFHDILQLDLIDHSRNLSFKTIGLFHWIKQFCGNASFVMKTDDDIFVNTRVLLQVIKDMPTGSKVIMGHVIKGAQPITDRNDPWYNPPQIYKGRTYPNYLSGSAYLFNSSLIPLLLSSARENPVFWLEDIYITGILAKHAQISLLHNPKFIFLKPELMFDFCKYSEIQVVHGIDADEIKRFWKVLNTSNC